MKGNTRRVALVLELDWAYKRHASVYAGTQQYFDEQGWESVIDEYALDSLPSRRGTAIPYDGVIARATKSLAQRCDKLNVPLVNVWSSSALRDEIPGVYPDYQASGRLRAEHLLARGLCNFAVLGSRRDSADYLEMQSFVETIRDQGHACEVAWMSRMFSDSLSQWRTFNQTIATWMDKWELPVGTFIGADSVGRIVVQKCKERGWRIPEDVVMIAGRNEETLCESPRPSITSMEMGYERVGYEAAKLLHRLMNGEHLLENTVHVPPQGIVVRESTDFLITEDELIAAALSFIASNSHRRIGQDDVARALSVETRTLQNRFRKVLDQSIAATIRRVRLERAKRELVQSNRSLKNIARDAGFGSAMRMYDLFKRELGMTPTQFRKQRRL
ncbi:Xylose operon regulatory protein [Bremerella volcania]|uniref:Xylose operon regulatory protein n=1 Tax=Bremerella volcania TaxID=2527984 RepID=A0A518C9C5_9BACT|nr:substrate-binding domain-containing protein [Bremerella volcania]QDU75825.1 Xylose operon regulatory protein [Bremerella volcania]